jgi:outer membrane immunogenic protein
MKGLEHMENVNRLAYLFFSLSLISTSVSAATWQGPYVGAFLGEGFGNNHTSTSTGSVTDTSYFTTPADINSVNNAGTSTKNPASMIVGIQAGHDWVWKQMVYGVAFDYSTLPLSSSTNVSNNTYPDSSDQYSIYTSMSTNWLFTLRGRLGYQTMLHWPTLFYLTGGMALTQLKVNNSFSDNSAFSGAGGTSNSENKIGWTAGAGIELASFKHVSVDLEYLYVHMPSVKTNSSITNTEPGIGIPAQSLTSTFSTTGNFHASLIKLGLNYRFDEA